MGTAPAPTVEGRHAKVLQGSTLFKSHAQSRISQLHLWVYDAFGVFTTQIFVSQCDVNLKTFLIFQGAHFGKL